jgi:hypothetical protein
MVRLKLLDEAAPNRFWESAVRCLLRNHSPDLIGARRCVYVNPGAV